MPNFVLRAVLRWVPDRRFILRGALVIVKRAKTTSGANFPQARVRAFATLTDVVVARDVSDGSGLYGVSVPDAVAAYYTVVTQDATFDSTALTWDNTGATFDRTQSVGGVSSTALRGSS